MVIKLLITVKKGRQHKINKKNLDLQLTDKQKLIAFLSEKF